MSDDFGIGLSGELVSFFDQLLFQDDVVLNNAVVHHDNAPGAIAMGMSVLFRGTAVRGPASVADAVSAIDRLEPDDFLEVAQLAFSAADLQALAIAADRNSGGVVTAIFEPFQPIQNDRHNAFLSDISDDATHSDTPLYQRNGRGSKLCFELLSGRELLPATGGRIRLLSYSSREKRNSSITGFVSTSRAIRATSASASDR